MNRLAATVGTVLFSASSLFIASGCSSSNQASKEVPACSKGCRLPFSDLAMDMGGLIKQLDKVSILISDPKANADTCSDAIVGLEQSFNVLKYSLSSAFSMHVSRTSVTEVFSDPDNVLSGQNVYEILTMTEDLSNRISFLLFSNSMLSESDLKLLEDMAYLKFKLLMLAHRLEEFEYPLAVVKVDKSVKKEQDTTERKTSDR